MPAIMIVTVFELNIFCLYAWQTTAIMIVRQIKTVLSVYLAKNSVHMVCSDHLVKEHGNILDDDATLYCYSPTKGFVLPGSPVELS